MEIRKFRVKYEGFFFTVHIFASKRSMHEFYRVWHIKHPEALKKPYDDFWACVLPEWKYRGKKPRKNLGHVIFCVAHLCEMVVSHEAVHMAAHYMRTVPDKTGKRNKTCILGDGTVEDIQVEEDFACIHSGYMTELMKVLHEEGFWCKAPIKEAA